MNTAAIHLSLISHTNAGKTTLARTLLGRDIGEIRDAAHVTEVAEGYPMIALEDGTSLLLWDTPGFGDTARLLKRLKLSGNPLGWLLSQVWDRYADRPFWCSQQAIRNARDNADVVLYLVNASEDPDDAGYVGLEMQILAWIGKPVIVLLNQMGPPTLDTRQEEDRWRTHLKDFEAVKEILTLDAFARCWVQEGALLERVHACLPEEKKEPMGRLCRAWQQKNRARFQASMRILARQLAMAACDREVVAQDEGGRLQGLANVLRRRSHPGHEKAMLALAQRLDALIKETTDALIREHALGGHAAGEILRRVRDNFHISHSVKEGYAAMFGGLASGAMGGLAADLAAGGLTLGGGMLAGGILGALGAGGLARGYNLVRGEKEPALRWSDEFLIGLVQSALLRYLAVAHFGRGRGNYVQSESPAFWQHAVAAVVDRRRDRFMAAWTTGRQSRSPSSVEETLATYLEDCAAQLLEQFYPEARGLR